MYLAGNQILWHSNNLFGIDFRDTELFTLLKHDLPSTNYKNTLVGY